jgi:hypothetical protein
MLNAAEKNTPEFVGYKLASQVYDSVKHLREVKNAVKAGRMPPGKSP